MSTKPASKKALADVAFECGQRLASDPNISAVGYGVKLRDGAAVGGESLVFFVREKLGTTQQLSERSTWHVPAEIEGFQTDVVELGALAAAAADRTPPAGSRGQRIADPLLGGVATMSLGAAPSGPGGYGTVGGHCFDIATRAPLLLSNAHVWGQVAGVEVVQPVTATSILGAAVSPATSDGTPRLVQTRAPVGLTAPIAFANAIAQTYLITGGDDDPLFAGQIASPTAASTRTLIEGVTVNAPIAWLPPAGARISPSVTWSYQRVSDTAVVQNGSTAPRTVAKLLTARRLFTNAASYSAGQTIQLYAEIVPGAGAGATHGAHHALALLYPLATGEKFIARLLRAGTRQSVTTVTTSFAGFAAPARVGPAALPAVAGAFAVDAELNGTFVAPPGGSGLPAGTVVLRLPAGSVRLFVPIGTEVVVDIDFTGAPGPLGVVALNSARDVVAANVTNTAGTGNRRLLTVSGSEIVELVLTGVTNAQLFGVTSRRSSPETTPPLVYTGTANASNLLPKGKWGASLFVQAVDSGAVELANIVETAIGLATFVNDCTFDVT